MRTKSVKICLNLPVLLFGAFITWIIVTLPSAVFPTLSGFSVWHFVSAWVVAVIIVSFRINDQIASRTIIEAVATVITGHILLASAQVIIGGPLGLPFLGESQQIAAGSVSIGGITLAVGKHIQGLAYRGPFSVLLTLSLPILAALAWDTHARRRHLWAVITILGGITLLLTGWDAAYGGTIIAFSALILLRVAGKHQRDVAVTGIVTSVGLIGAVLVFILGAAVGSGVSGGQLISVNSTVNAASKITLPGFSLANLPVRIRQYSTGINIILDRPITGFGFGYFYEVSPQLGFSRPHYMHNFLLQLIVSYGVIGAGLYSSAVITGLFSIISQVNNEMDTILQTAAFAGLVGVHAQLLLQPQLIRITSLAGIWILIVGAMNISDLRES
jgi:hypothetical protein